jgi:hypothetical protein
VRWVKVSVGVVDASLASIVDRSFLRSRERNPARSFPYRFIHPVRVTCGSWSAMTHQSVDGEQDALRRIGKRNCGLVLNLVGLGKTNIRNLIPSQEIVSDSPKKKQQGIEDMIKLVGA